MPAQERKNLNLIIFYIKNLRVAIAGQDLEITSLSDNLVANLKIRVYIPIHLDSCWECGEEIVFKPALGIGWGGKPRFHRVKVSGHFANECPNRWYVKLLNLCLLFNINLTSQL